MFRSISSKICENHRSKNIFLSTASQAGIEINVRTLESDPSKHTVNNLAQFYSIPRDIKSKLFQHGGIPKTFTVQAQTFNETCLMIRKPALDIINCLKSIDYSKPVVRFVLYGKKGSGKSLSLVHIIHWAHNNDFLLFHVPWVGNWMRRAKEFSNSETKEGFVNLNLDASAWLMHFKTQNAELLKDPALVVNEDIEWSKREVTQKGAPLLELVEHGISRVKFASDCVNILAENIKALARDGRCRTLVAVDGFNAFFYPKTRVYTEKKEMVPPSRVVLAEAFRNLSKFDWRNGAVVVTVDEIAIAEEDQISHLPRYLLGKDGFEHMDPFVPISVPAYSDKEVLSCMEYYRERKWVTPYPGQDDELRFLSAGNPYKLMELCASL
ncbi:small ribosomal subunit protein mS29 [Cylas formicarius]|uniref:small ribosomal subunit protein mS29 n=1 Tax=Cylas formicarius TaxID=197179 RepID=UPI00295847F5|nr:small ribosomal subunit protein mS29 [Cylas formicarius]